MFPEHLPVKPLLSPPPLPSPTVRREGGMEAVGKGSGGKGGQAGEDGMGEREEGGREGKDRGGG